VHSEACAALVTLHLSFCVVVTLAPKLEFVDCKAEFVFVVDRSGSMSGSGIKHAASALTLFLRSPQLLQLLGMFYFQNDAEL
jgi:hypothetical protein